MSHQFRKKSNLLVVYQRPIVYYAVVVVFVDMISLKINAPSSARKYFMVKGRATSPRAPSFLMAGRFL